jgi:hypothetical protein
MARVIVPAAFFAAMMTHTVAEDVIRTSINPFQIPVGCGPVSRRRYRSKPGWRLFASAKGDFMTAEPVRDQG